MVIQRRWTDGARVARRGCRLNSYVTHMAPAFGLADAAAPLSSASIDARLACRTVITAAALTATMYTFHIALHTT